MIISTIVWLLVGVVTLGLAVVFIVAVIAILVARMGDDADWRD